MSSPAVVAALASLTRNSPAAALASLEGDGTLVGTALSAYLAGGSSGHVYDRPAAFAAFIRGGGNVALYAAVASALGSLYDTVRPTALLDVGCGDGSALAAGLACSAYRPARVEVVEPSPALLATATSALEAAGFVAHPVTAQAFVSSLKPSARWDLVQSTFALHAMTPSSRSAVLSALRPHLGVLVLAEFDVPALAPGSEEHLSFLATTYERGLAEYDADRDLVAQGFLMPVLTGQLAPGAVRSTYEQTASAWLAQLQDAGYTEVDVTPLYDYWSSPAVLLTARGGG